jgi:hypothetical protein
MSGGDWILIASKAAFVCALIVLLWIVWEWKR